MYLYKHDLESYIGCFAVYSATQQPQTKVLQMIIRIALSCVIYLYIEAAILPITWEMTL